MLKPLKSSLMRGILLSTLLLGFGVMLFITLFLSSSEPMIWFDFPPRIGELLTFTLYQATLSTLLALGLGLLLAWSLSHQSHFWGRSFLVALFSSSLVLPTLIVVFGLITILGRNGWVNQLSLLLFQEDFGSYLYGLGGILIAHVYFNASFASRALFDMLESIPPEKYKLALTLNLNPFWRFVYVEFPALKPTLLSLASTIFLLCFTSFAIVLILGGSPAYNTLEVAIYEAVKLDFDMAMALKLALIQLSLSLILVLLSSRFSFTTHHLNATHHPLPWRESKTIQRIQWGVIVLFTLFYFLPLIAIVIEGIGADFGKIFASALFQKSLLTSLILATLSAFITVIFALILGDVRRNFTLEGRLAHQPYAKLLTLLIAFSGHLSLAIPSLILGLGFFLLSQRYEASLFVWSSVALLSANVLMSLPFALSVLTPMMAKTAQRYDKLLFSLSLSPLQRWVYCEYPYLKSSLGYIFALSFALSLGDLGIIALFGNEAFSTLPWYLYGLMGSYQTHDAQGVALILLALTLGMFLLIPLLTRSDRVKNR